MSLHDDLDDLKGLAKMVFAQNKEEKKNAERESRTVQLVCPYCGESSRFVWEEGMLPKCPNCGSTFDADDEQIKKLQEQQIMRAESDIRAREKAAIDSAKTRNKIRMYIIIGIIVILLIIVAVIVAKINGGSLHMGGDATFNFHVGS